MNLNYCNKKIIFGLLYFFESGLSNAIQLSIVDLQKFRTDTVSELSTGGDTGQVGFVRLINLNPNVNAWYLLYLDWPGKQGLQKIHLENPYPEQQVYFLAKDFKNGLKIATADASVDCELWGNKNTPSPFSLPENFKKSFVPLCDGKMIMRNQTEGAETTKEWVADFLRSHVWKGDEITTMVKELVYKDRFLLTGERDKSATKDASLPLTQLDGMPVPALIDDSARGTVLPGKELGIKLKNNDANALKTGQWYQSAFRSGIYVSSIAARSIKTDILNSYRERVRELDDVENSALVYMVAFDLNKFRLGYALGTKHPSSEWSERTPEKVIRRNMPGPDGIGEFQPIQLTGKVSPMDAPHTIAAFTGGFKRTHSAFKWGRLSQVNFGSHYGFIENGVVFSRLQPELATLVVRIDGSVDMKTWTKEDDATLSDVKFARQNGVPIIEYDAEQKIGIPGAYVNKWNLGNWSGSVDSKQRALRAGICMQKTEKSNFLIYGYFSSVTPNAMARIFQAYGCSYALHLDMNALEHTYLALYKKEEKNLAIQHVISGMSVLDRTPKGTDTVVPRFVGTADNRDFFYLTEKY